MNGVVLASERRVVSKLLTPPKVSDKVYKISSHVVVSVAGMAADASILINQCRLKAARHHYQYGEDAPVEQVVEAVCNYKQAYTQYGGLRPFGVAFLFAGYDVHHGVQLFQTDPSGNYSGWRATVIGANSAAGKSYLKSEYDKDGSGPPLLSAGLRLAVKCLNKTMDATAATSDKYELFTLTVEPDTGRCAHHVLTEEETRDVLEQVEAETKAAGDE